MTPWKIQEKVSSNEAVFFGVTRYSWAISFAIGFAITIATVLLAVAMSIAPTRSPIPSCPPRFPLNIRWIQPSNASNPPYSRISAHMAATRIATIQVSNMPETPEPIFASRSVGVVCPPSSMISAPEAIPVRSTTNTLIPMIPPIRTST